MDLMETATKLLGERLEGANTEAIPGALAGLLGTDGGQLDIAGLIGKFAGAGGMAATVQSWLGNGSNEGIDASKIMEVFGGGEIGAFADKVGVSTEQASSGLADVLPKLVDQFSDGGNLLGGLGDVGGLLDKAGGAGGLLSKAKGFFGK